MDGMEYAKDGRIPWQWGTTSLDNVTNAYEDGFLGECVKAGKDRCALAGQVDQKVVSTELEFGIESEVTTIEIQQTSTKNQLIAKMHNLLESVKQRPIPGYTTLAGPGIVTYESLIGLIYGALYRPDSWPATAKIFSFLMDGNSTLALEAINSAFAFDPETNTTQSHERHFPHHWVIPPSGSVELTSMVICGDSWNAEKHDLDWWMDLRDEMAKK